jgi:outer membrane immunogenic protein
MKKLVLALISSVVVAGAAGAHGGHINSGFYLGAHGGYGSTTGNTNGQVAGVALAGTADVGSNTGNIGVHGGYGYVTGCLYVGGEVGYTFENTKINSSLGNAAGTSALQLKRNGYFNAALRGGYLFTPGTMGYVRLGGNVGKWTINDRLVAFTNAVPGTGSKNRISFTPGLGLETAVHKNIYLRVEYNYEFGTSIQARNAARPTTFLNIGNLRSQSGNVGLSYKF